MNTYQAVVEPDLNQIQITAVKVFQLKGHGIQSLIKVETDAGVYGVGEAGLPAKIVQGYLDFMQDSLIGMDPLAIEKCYASMTRMQAQWHAHWVQNPTISGIDIALWDIAGKVLKRPISALLTGRFRDEIQLYVNTLGPTDWFDRTACRDWADEISADPHGFKVVKLGFEGLLGKGLPANRYQPGFLSKTLYASDFRKIRKGFENIREELGWDIDFILHCHNEWDLPTALGLAEAVAPVKPLWIEDPLPVLYSDTWRSLCQNAMVRIATGEKLEHPAEYLQFLSNDAIHVLHPDIAFVGGLTGGRKIADLAELHYIPVATHNVGSFIQLMATAHFGASVRNFVMSENRIPQGGLYEEMSEEGYEISGGMLRVPVKPGLGITLIPEIMNQIIENGTWE
jgi:L-alanine-DL-glutamate epimerase-like enolase superfamily enzyme